MIKKFDNQSAFTTNASQHIFNQLQETIKRDYSNHNWYNLMNEYVRNYGYTLIELEPENESEEE